MSKLKLTGFGRLFIFLLIVGPLVYFGMQYLKNNGTLDRMKEKMEDTGSSDQVAVEEKSDNDILQEIDRKSNTNNRDEQAIIEEQRRKIEELERKNQELQQKKKESSNSEIPEITIPEPDLSPSNRGTDDAPSLDDLIAQAENNLGRPSNSETESSATRKSLASWTFTYSGVKGMIEFFEQNNRLMSRATYQGMDRVDIFELDRQGDNFYVKDSPTDEYYVLRQDGSLDAYDSSGFQTTCQRR